MLAAGSASRFGGNKLSAQFQGEPLVFHAIRAARAAPVDTVIVICKADIDTGNWPGNPPVRRVEFHSDAMSSSLKAGIAAAGDAHGAFVFLGDMPLVPHDVARRLSEELGNGFAAVPRRGGQPGHPVLLSAKAFRHIARLNGDEGAGKLLKQRGDVTFIDYPDEKILLDVDRPADLTRLENRPDGNKR